MTCRWAGFGAADVDVPVALSGCAVMTGASSSCRLSLSWVVGRAAGLSRFEKTMRVGRRASSIADAEVVGFEAGSLCLDDSGEGFLGGPPGHFQQVGSARFRWAAERRALICGRGKDHERESGEPRQRETWREVTKGTYLGNRLRLEIE